MAPNARALDFIIILQNGSDHEVPAILEEYDVEHIKVCLAHAS